MTIDDVQPADNLVKVTAEGGPLDGVRFTTDRATSVLHALALKDASGAWVDPRKWANSHGFAIPEDMPPTQWPAEVTSRVVQVEYLIDHAHETAAFREPAEIREAKEAEPEREWEPVNPRTVQEPRMIAWKAAAGAIEATGALLYNDDGTIEECSHSPHATCQTAPMHDALVAVDAILADGLRITEPTRYAGAAEALAYLFHEAYERLAPKHGWETQEESRVPWHLVPDANRNLMIDSAREVLEVLDMEGRVVVIRIPANGPSLADQFESLGNLLRDECGASLLLALPADLGLTIETLDEEQMSREGWVRIPDAEPEPVEKPPLLNLASQAEQVAAGEPESETWYVAHCSADMESWTAALDPTEAAVETLNVVGDAVRDHVRAEHADSQDSLSVSIEVVQ